MSREPDADGRAVGDSAGRDVVDWDRRAASRARLMVTWSRRRLGRLAGRGPTSVLSELQLVVEATIDLERAAVFYVAAARDAGCTWEAIGSVLGVSRQAARARYGRAVRRRAAHRDDWRREIVATCPPWDGLVTVERRGVWEGATVLRGPTPRSERARRSREARQGEGSPTGVRT